LEHRASNPVSVKNLTATETSTIVKLLRPYVPVGTKRTSKQVSKVGLEVNKEKKFKYLGKRVTNQNCIHEKN
jgi:hypothetical protein